MKENGHADTDFMMPTDSVTPMPRDHRILENVNIVEERRVLIPISSIENLQAMDLISTGLITTGGIVAGFGGSRIELVPIGIAMFASGLFLHYRMVCKILRSWIKRKGHKIIVFQK